MSRDYDRGGGETEQRKRGAERREEREKNNQLGIDMQRGNREEAEQQMDAAVTRYCTQEHSYYQPGTQVQYGRVKTTLILIFQLQAPPWSKYVLMAFDM